MLLLKLVSIWFKLLVTSLQNTLQTTQICIFSVFRTWAWPAASSGAFKHLPRAHKPSHPPGCSGKGAVSKSISHSEPWMVWNRLGCCCFCFIIKCQLSLHLQLPKKPPNHQHFLSGVDVDEVVARCHIQSLTVQNKKKPHDSSTFPQNADELLPTFVWQTPRLLWPYFTSCFGQLYYSYA